MRGSIRERRIRNGIVPCPSPAGAATRRLRPLPAKGGERLREQLSLNGDQNAFEIAKNIIVPESKHSISVSNYPLIAHRICRGFIVLSAVDFDYKKSFAANEVADVTGYRLLPYKFMSTNLPVANTIPENGFRICLIDAQSSRDSDHFAIWATHCLAPHPKFPLRANFDLSPQRAGRG